MKNKILIYGECNFNTNNNLDCSIITLIKLLAQDKNNIIDLLLKTKIHNNALIADLKHLDNVTILNCSDYRKYSKFNSFNISKTIEKIDEYRDYSCIIIKGYKILNSLINNKINAKIIPYLTIPCSNKEENILTKIYPIVNFCFVNSNKDLENFKNIINFDQKKFYILNQSEYTTQKQYENIKSCIYSYPMKKLRLLVSGHDLKFIKDLFPYFEKEFDLKIQEFSDYVCFNEKDSKKLLKEADIIWCEWLLTGARWYSNNILPHQKLFIRAHRFEKYRKYGYEVNYENVTKIITVSYYYYEEFIKKFSMPREKVTVISNFIDTKKYLNTKNNNFKYNVALIGCLPVRKGLDRAVDILIKLKQYDNRYKLFVPGNKPEEVGYAWNVPESKNYYLNVYKKIKDNNLEDSVVFNGWVEIPKLLKDIGFTLSVSDSKEPESFHLAIAETMVSGRNWSCN